MILLATMLLAATAMAGPGAILERPADADAPEPATMAIDKSFTGTVEVVTGHGGEVWANIDGFWQSLEYPSTEDLYDIAGETLEDLWVCGAGGVRHYDGTEWGDLEDLGDDINGILVRDDGVVAVGDNGRAMRFEDGDWVNLASGVAQDLNGIWGTSADDFWVCGEGGVIRRYVAGDWSPIASGTSTGFNDVWGMTGVGPYFVGDTGFIVQWENGSIVPMGSGVSDDLVAIDGTSARNVWAVGDEWKAVRFNGFDWQDQSAPGSFNFNDVSALPSGTSIVVDANGNLPTFDGSSWQTRDIGPDIFLTGIVSVPPPPGSRWWDGFGRPERGGLGLQFSSGPGQGSNVEVIDGQLVVLGDFDRGGDNTNLSNIATFDGEAWTELAPVQEFNLGELLTGYDGNITFFGVVDDTLGVYTWDDAAWERLGEPFDSGWFPINLRSVTTSGIERLLLVGQIENPDSPGESLVYEWADNLEEWITVGDGVPYAPSTYIYSIVAFEDDLYLCGEFEIDGTSHGQVYRLTGGNPLGTWEVVFDTTDFAPLSLLVHQGDLYMGGGLATNVDVLRRYDPDTGDWDPMGVIGSSGFIFDLASWGDRIVMVGSYSSLSDVPSANASYWEDGEVFPMGRGTNSRANTAIAFEGDLYTVGMFSEASGVESWGIARWGGETTATGPPIVQVNVPDAAEEGVLVPVTCNVTSYQSVQEVTLTYRDLDSSSFRHTEMQPSGKADGSYEAVIPGASVSEYGVQFFVTVQTDQYTVTHPPDPAEEAAFVGIEINNAVWNAPLPERYELMGVPFAAAGSMAQIFEDDLGGYDASLWRMEWYDPGAGGYVRYDQAGFPPAEPGTGYWLIQRDPVPIDISGATTSTAGGLDITLEPGWNMIAAPYLFTVPWSDVTLPFGVEEDLIGRTNDMYTVETELVPWRGYFVRHNGAAPVVINIPAAPSDKAAAPAEEPRDPEGVAWSVGIDVRQGDRTDLPKVIGAVEADVAGPGDLHQPPALDHDLAVWIEREIDERPHRLRRDLRPVDGGEIWDLVIRPASGQDERVELAFDGLETVPAELAVALVTPGETVDLRAKAGEWSAPGSGETRVRLVVGDPELVEEAAETLPQPFALLPNYPNPFNPATRLVFTTPRSGVVTVELYDVAGRRVRTLVDEVRPAGRHEVLWNGADDAGRALSSGVYFARMRADGFEQTRKMTLVR
ncbi:T9SS type A sorting domain-containing protein [bacterium]|nr:T9SS type A sorting domain-containing protein [bacterium]